MDKLAPQGVLASLAALTRNSLCLLVARLELAALELAEVRNHVLALLGLFMLVLVCAAMALAYGSAMVVVLSWDALGWKVLLLFFLGFALAAWLLLQTVRQMLADGKIALPETM
ncbi:MAG: phage holin family protein, partial [Pseudomonadota bacterium]